MGQITVTIRTLVVSTEGARFKHFISPNTPRTWCDRMAASQFTSRVSFYSFTGAYLTPETEEQICPRCLHYFRWIQQHSIAPPS